MDAPTTADVFLFEEFRLDRGGLFRRDQSGTFVPVMIGSRALEILAVLVARSGELVTKDELIDKVWPGTIVESSNLPVQIASLRRALDHGRANGSLIHTVPGRGYRFVLPVARGECCGVLSTGPQSGNGARALIAERGEPKSAAATSQPPTSSRAMSGRARPLRHGILAILVGALCLLAAAITTLRWHSLWSVETPSAGRLSIVVMPFANLGNDPDQQYFADGVVEDLTTDLSHILDVFVISADTAFTYRNKPIDAKQIGRELGVRYVVEGSVERVGDRARVNAQLIDAETDKDLWADRFDRQVSNLLSLQSEITSRIANALRLEVIAAEARRRPEPLDALDYIFRGRDLFFGKSPSSENFKNAVALYERALALDPQSARAKTFLAGVLINRVIQGLSDTKAADAARAEQLIDEALAAAPRIPWAHYVKGTVLRAKGQWEAAIPEFETARSLDRNMIGPLQGLAWCKLYTGSVDEVVPLAEKGIRLDPHDPTVGFRYLAIGEVYQLQSRPDEAILSFEKARGTISAVPGLWAHLASAHALAGDTELAAAELAEARRLNGNVFSSLAHLKASTPWWGVPKIQALFDATYFAGLRKAGMAEE